MKLETNSTNSNLTKKELIVSFTSMGIAFKAVASSNVLNVLPVVGNTSLAGNVLGILGNFDEDPNNDLQSPTGEILEPNSTAEKIYDDFGILWRIQENDSLFTYEAGKSYSDYQKLSFRPTFVTPTNLPPEVEELCGGDEECVFDYAVTGSAELAAETQQFTVVFNTSVGASYQIKNCDDLPTIEGGVWNASSTIEGSTATFSCYPGYEIEGESNEITCRNTSWGNFGNFACNLIITSSTFESTTVLVSTDNTADSVTTSGVEETTIIPTDTESTTIISTEGTITSASQSTARRTTAEISSTSEATTISSTTTNFPSTEDLASTFITTEVLTEFSTSNVASSTMTESYEEDLTSPSREGTTEYTTMASTSTILFPSTTPNKTTTEHFTTLSSTVSSATGQSTIILSTTSGSIPTDTSTQRESTTEELEDATQSPVQRAVQQIDDFIEENYKYFIIGFVFVCICSILLGILIHRKCVKSKKPENLEHWHPQRDRDLTKANHPPNQNRHKNPSSAYFVEQKTSSDGFKFYKYVKRSKR